MMLPRFGNLSFLGGMGGMQHHPIFGGMQSFMPIHNPMQPIMPGNSFMPQQGTMMPSWGSQMPPMQGAMMPRSPQINLSALGGSQMRRSPYGY
jgi:hypothetical protein